MTTMFSELRQHFDKGCTRTLAYRKQQLSGLMRFLQECESEIFTALATDIGKPQAESLSAEIGLVMSEAKLLQKNLARWMKPKRVATPLLAQPGKSVIYPEPLGVVLVIAPWNYPLQLTLAPLAGALAAGNCVVLKPSEMAAATSQLLADRLPRYIDTNCLAIVQGGIDETTALLREPFDHIFYTGSGAVGKIVMTAAAKNLTPVTLELGGKSPCIVDEETDLDVAAKRIIWGKFSNAGQTCVAPDYVLAHENIEERLLLKLREKLQDFYGNDPRTSRDYGRIINERHYQRLMNLLPGSGEVYVGGQGDAATRYFPPTILSNVPADAPVMAEEIFGPILPVLKVKNMHEAIQFVNARPKPLALYIFSSNKITCENIIERTSSGGVSVNYPMMQLTIPDLPFGGVGASGMGAYHGKASFDTFTHYKSVLMKPLWFDLSVMYPPYSPLFMRLCRLVFGC